MCIISFNFLELLHVSYFLHLVEYVWAFHVPSINNIYKWRLFCIFCPSVYRLLVKNKCSCLYLALLELRGFWRFGNTSVDIDHIICGFFFLKIIYEEQTSLVRSTVSNCMIELNFTDWLCYCLRIKALVWC